MRRAWDCVPLEHYLLMLDYQIMQVLVSPDPQRIHPAARRALEEMAGVVSHIAYKMGERAASFSQA